MKPSRFVPAAEGSLLVPTDVDVVVIGGGVAGSALAVALARAGISVLILERTAEHVDRVRGEWLAPWGVAEAQALGLYDALMAAGAHHTRRHVPFGEGIEPDVARTRAIDLTSVVPGVPGALCMPHVALCNVLNELATAAGVILLRGVHGVEITPGARPEVRFPRNGAEQRVRCRLIVGADGRGSIVARQAGIEMKRTRAGRVLLDLCSLCAAKAGVCCDR
jgi:2-polyprenyl-6-methoxyphenol hydroxylase-like FAD-dependent oxidoreductase